MRDAHIYILIYSPYILNQTFSLKYFLKGSIYWCGIKLVWNHRVLHLSNLKNHAKFIVFSAIIFTLSQLSHKIPHTGLYYNNMQRASSLRERGRRNLTCLSKRGGAAASQPAWLFYCVVCVLASGVAYNIIMFTRDFWWRRRLWSFMFPAKKSGRRRASFSPPRHQHRCCRFCPCVDHMSSAHVTHTRAEPIWSHHRPPPPRQWHWRRPPRLLIQSLTQRTGIIIIIIILCMRSTHTQKPKAPHNLNEGRRLCAQRKKGYCTFLPKWIDN